MAALQTFPSTVFAAELDASINHAIVNRQLTCAETGEPVDASRMSCSRRILNEQTTKCAFEFGIGCSLGKSGSMAESRSSDRVRNYSVRRSPGRGLPGLAK